MKTIKVEIEIEVHDKADYVTINKYGDITQFIGLPSRSDAFGALWYGDDESMFLTSGNVKNWQDMLIKIKKEKE
jgi:hypothetical protein